MGADSSKESLVLEHHSSETSYFVAHLIEKMSEWGPYKKVNKLSDNDLNIVKSYIEGLTPIAWFQYENYAKNGCSYHN